MESVLIKLRGTVLFPKSLHSYYTTATLSPGGSYPAHWKYFRSYCYLLIALLGIYYSGQWMLLSLQLSGISMICKILLWPCPCVCKYVYVCVLSGHKVCLLHAHSLTYTNRQYTAGVVCLMLITGYELILSGQ